MEDKEYAWNAADYARHSSGQFRWAQELMDKLCLQGDEAVLDIGCGAGRVSAELAARVPQGRVVGIDLAPGMVQLARESFPQRDHANLSFQQADARDLAFTKAFDVAFSNATLHWVIDHRPVLRGVYRALKPGGRLLFQMGGAGNAVSILAVLEGLLATPRWARYFSGFTFPYGFHGHEDYQRWLSEAGLQPTRAELIPKWMRHQGREGLMGWIRTTWLPYTERVPEGERDAFIDAIADGHLRRKPLGPDGTAGVQMVRLEVEAFRPG